MTFANFLLRRIEKVLEQESGHYQLKVEKFSETLDEAFGALSDANSEILIGIEDLHLGQLNYRGEPVSVLDLYRMLPKAGNDCLHASRLRHWPLFSMKLWTGPSQKKNH